MHILTTVVFTGQLSCLRLLKPSPKQKKECVLQSLVWSAFVAKQLLVANMRVTALTGLTVEL